MEHVFTESVDGMRDENCLIVPGTPRIGPLARLLVPFLFPDGKSQAWLKHNIEEMDTLENFLPKFYEREAKHESVDQVALV